MKIPKLYHLGMTAVVIAILGTTIAGCAQRPAQAQIAQSEVDRETSPTVDPADQSDLAAGNRFFALDLYHALRGDEGNLFFSPFSVSAALAMTYAGARGGTERQMADTLHFILPQDRLHTAFNALDRELLGRNDDDFKLHIANAIWGQNGYAFLAEFLDILARNYGAGLRLLDFGADPEEARQVINDWVEDQTEERIKNLIPPGAIRSNTRLVLANAIYFNAKWLHPFVGALTRDGEFTTLDGTVTNVPMMSMVDPATLLYAQGDGYEAVEIPYEGGEMSMVILLPEIGGFDAFEGALKADNLAKILGELESKQVDLKLPKFSYESEFGLAQTLADMGMPSAFGDADFSGMDGSRNLFISNVFHKAFIAVDEEGTEAAAATAVVVVERAAPMADVELRVDRPFVFLIRDLETDTVLFVGRFVTPGQ